NGNILTVTDIKGIITREYDALNRVTKYTDYSGNIITYTYDAVGNLETLTYPEDKAVNYEYSVVNSLTKVTDWAGRTTTYEYDANSRLTKENRPNGTTCAYAYDEAGQITQQKDTDQTGNTINQYDYQYDKTGNITTETMTQELQTVQTTTIVMTYDTHNRLATYNGLAVEYDADGNMTKGPLGGELKNFTYDSNNRLTSVAGTTYTYDTENNRIATTDANGTTTYVINPQSNISQLLIKTDPNGQKTYYIYGLGLIGQEDTDGTYKTYHYDKRGSTTAITDIAGAVTDRYDYGPYGEQVGHTGNTVTPFLYNGRDGVMTDTNGLYYMRARYYNPEIKRFINQDVLLGNITEGQSLNKYAYVNGNPISYTDPFGLSRDITAQVGAELLLNAVTLAMDMTPGLAEAKGILQIANGKDIITGQELSRLGEAGNLAINTLIDVGMFTGVFTAVAVAAKSTRIAAGTRKVFTAVSRTLAKVGAKAGELLATTGTKVVAKGTVNTETFYRTISKEDYEILLKTGKVPATRETFISPTQSFAEGYNGITVEFKVNVGTTNEIANAGVRDFSDLTKNAYSSMPTVQKGWNSSSAYFKKEGSQINIGLGKGNGLDIFNNNIVDYKVVGGR
ncbi:MAG TPA: hypothetical protein DEP72_05440, partial [Clostridiales bacterium]|nr:hypothetical protein [Clostridiales bacterium]